MGPALLELDDRICIDWDAAAAHEYLNDGGLGPSARRRAS
jgi:hypothetical protein